MLRTNAIRIGVMLLLSAALSACGSKVSMENYDKIAEDMKEEEVTRILGIPSESRSTTAETYTSTQSKWRGDKGTIVVMFLNSEVQKKRFYPPGAEPAPEPR